MAEQAMTGDRILLLVTESQAWNARLSALATGLVPELTVCPLLPASQQKTDGAAVCLYIRDDGHELPGVLAGPCREHWLIQADPLLGRDEVFAAGFTEIIPAAASDRELALRFSRLARTGNTTNALLEGLGGFSRVGAVELAAPIQGLSLGQAAAHQELATLKPLFDDLHKAWFTGNEALLERLRLMLAVINLKDSWANLERTVEDFGLGIERLREIHIVLTWTAGMAEAVPSRQTVQEIAQACIGFVRESAGSGVTFANRVPHERAIQVPARLFFAALLATVSRILDLFCRLGNGRGSIELRSMEKDAFWRKRHAGRGGMWSARSLVLAARPEMPVDWQPHPAAGYEAGLFARLGAEPDWTIRGEILEIGFWLPETAGGPGGSDAG